MSTRTDTRRRFLATFSSLGLSSTLLPGILWARAMEEKRRRITPELIEEAEVLAGLELAPAEREQLVSGLERQLGRARALHAVAIENRVAPALVFRAAGTAPRPAAETGKVETSGEEGGATPEGAAPPAPPGAARRREPRPVPANLEDLAFWPLGDLARAIEARRVSSLDLTRMVLARLRRLDPKLHCVITFTDELALAQARRADEEIARGRYRGPLHGIPWGAKDLLAARRYPTTWGAKPYEGRVLDEDATVVTRLEEAGAVLVAKLTLGALAMGDVWFGGRTRNPWDPRRGSSGSSAGPAAATAAGGVGFSIGSETRGSIISPCTVCGATGLRPTFGRVSRAGAMALSWSMDKLGPICRAAEDCALVFDAIRGPDGKDPTVVDAPFEWPCRGDPRKLRIGFLESAFEAPRDPRWRANDRAVLEALRSLGMELVPIELPDLPVEAMSDILEVEAAAAFDELTRSGRDDLLARQDEHAWPSIFRRAHFVSGVDYVQANRLRTLAIEAMAELTERVDLYVTPSWVGDNLALTNLTGHPAVVVPDGFDAEGLPTSITFTGRLHGEAELLAVAAAYQEATGFHRKHPKL